MNLHDGLVFVFGFIAGSLFTIACWGIGVYFASQGKLDD